MRLVRVVFLAAVLAIAVMMWCSSRHTEGFMPGQAYRGRRGHRLVPIKQWRKIGNRRFQRAFDSTDHKWVWVSPRARLTKM